MKPRKLQSRIGNGTDLRPDSGSAASSGSTCDWSFSKSDLYRGAINTPAGAAYLQLRRARCAAACRSRNGPITIRCVSSSALWQYVGSLAKSQYPSDIFTRQVSPLRHTKVGVSPLLTRSCAHIAARRMRSKMRNIPCCIASDRALKHYHRPAIPSQDKSGLIIPKMAQQGMTKPQR